MYKRLYYLGFVGYFLFFLFSVLFYKERTVLVDIAFHLFTLVTDNFCIQNMRFGAVATQVYPILATKMHLPLSGVMMAYSVGFIFYHFLYYIIIGLVLKKHNFALVLLLFNIIFISDTFYWIQSEFPQGISLFVLVLALCSSIDLKKIGSTILLSCIIMPLMVVVAFMHPLIIFPALFAAFFFLLQGKNRAINSKVIWGMTAFLMAAYAYKSLYFPNQYDSYNIENSLKSFTLQNLLTNYPNAHFAKNCLIKYYWVPVLTLAISAFYITRRQWANLTLFLLFLFGYFFMVNTSHPNSDATDFYMENLYLPLGFFISLPLVFHILPEIYSKNFASAVLLFIILTGAIRIYDLHATYTKRLTWERDFLKENLDKKLLIDSRKIPAHILQMVWGSPYEFWLLSTTENGRTASILISDHIQDYTKDTAAQKGLITTWFLMPYNQLPLRYFNFTDTVSKYSVLADQ